MIYFVTTNKELFENEQYKIISPDKALTILKDWSIFQFDTETTGRDPHLCKLLLMQFGNIKGDIQIVVDCTTISPLIFKEYIENNCMIGQNLKFDLQFLYNYNIIPLNVYDTMIVEQLLYLGYPTFLLGMSDKMMTDYCYLIYNERLYDSFNSKQKKEFLYNSGDKGRKIADFIYNHSGASLKALTYRYLNIEMDKSVRGEIIWRGIDTDVIIYAATDVKYLYEIVKKQLYICKEKSCINGARLECNFVPAIAYLEWCGIKIDIDKWKLKMKYDKSIRMVYLKALNNFIIAASLKKDTYISYISLSDKEEDDLNKERKLYKSCNRVPENDIVSPEGAKFEAYLCKVTKELSSKYSKRDLQGDLFEGFNTETQCTVNWNSSSQVVDILKTLGFNTKVIDKKTSEEKDSALEKVIKKQKGINDIFLSIYLNYKEADKVCSTYGQSYLNAINPKTGRIHTNFHQLGAASGRMSCGSQQTNTDLAKLKGLPLNTKDCELKCAYPQIQNLPADDRTRSCFISEKRNSFCSCDYSALESRLGADIYNEKSMINEYLHGSGDIHSLVAKACFPEELKDIPTNEVKKRRPDLRKKAKSPEFAKQFGGGSDSIKDSLGITKEEADKIGNAYDKGFPGVTKFGNMGAAKVKKNGYVLINPLTGHKMYWCDHSYWCIEQQSFNSEFWDRYRAMKSTMPYNEFAETWEKKRVTLHFKAASKWGRLSLNAPTQGTGIIILKYAITNFFKYIVSNNLFNIVKLVDLVHDEACIEYPESMKDVPDTLKKFMEESSSIFCKKLPIPADAEVGKYWIH